MFVIVVVALEGLVIVPPPEIRVHVPVVGATAAFAAIVAFTTDIPEKQNCWSGPAFEICAPALNTFNVISSNTVVPQVPFCIVQRKTYTPAIKLVICEVGEVGLLIAAPPGPLTWLQRPVAGSAGAVCGDPLVGRAGPHGDLHRP